MFHFHSCPRDVLKCKCNTYMESGVLKVFRTYVNPPRNYTEERELLPYLDSCFCKAYGNFTESYY